MPIFKSIVGSNLSPQCFLELENMFKSFISNGEDYILVETLKELFEDEQILEGIIELTDNCYMIIGNIIQYIQESNTNLIDLFGESIYQQDIEVNNENITLELINAKDFYGILKKINIITNEDKSLSNFLCLDEEYPDAFLVQKLVKLVEHVALAIEHQESEGILFIHR